MQSNGAAVNSEKQWTVMIYLSADNAIASDCVWALTEMQASSFEQELVAVVAQFDPPAKGIGTIQYDFTSPAIRSALPAITRRRLALSEVKLNAPLTDIQSIVTNNGENKDKRIERPIEKAFTDPGVLEGFIKTGILRYPAQHYIVVLSGLGSGALEGLLFDSDPVSEMKLFQLREALANVKNDFQKYLLQTKAGKIDILGLDCCLMGMVEVASELSEVVSYLVASEGQVPGTGWPYRQILETLSTQTALPSEEVAEEVAKGILTNYLDFYSDYITAGISVDQSVCDLSQVEGLEKAMRKLVGKLICEAEYVELGTKERILKPKLKDSIIVAHWKAQSYRSNQHVDLWDFCHCLEQTCNDDDVKTACKDVRLAIQAVVKKTAFIGSEFQHSHGLAIYFPWAISELPLINEYKNLIFAGQTGWGDFLEVYVKDTQRELQDGKLANKGLVYPPDYYFMGDNTSRLRDAQVSPKVRDPEIAPKVRDLEVSPKVRDPEISPKIRDLLFGGGAGAPKVTNPPTYFYQRPIAVANDNGSLNGKKKTGNDADGLRKNSKITKKPAKVVRKKR